MVDFCSERGVSRADWPIFYDDWRGDVDLDEIVRRCDRLRAAFMALNVVECADIPWLLNLHGWLTQGEVFAVFE